MIEVTLTVPFAAVETLDEFLLERGESRWMLMQDVIDPAAKLVGMFESEDEAKQSWEELRLAHQILMEAGSPIYRVLKDQDWRDSYKAHFKPWAFGRLHWVPVWERDAYAIRPGDAVIWLDPGLAFGTGNHETTRLCCERLVTLATTTGVFGRVIDAGCGSGILALSAYQLGFRSVAGFDNDPEAVRVSEENAALNGLVGSVEFFVGDLDTGLSGRSARVVLANIQADILMKFSQRLLDAVEQGGALVLSGILAREIEQVRSHFGQAARGWALESRILGEWADLFLVRNA